jgi:hypothetical protein
VGKYPKTFKFTGWHPLCRCKAVPILPSNEDTVDFATGELEKLDMVEKMPENFTGWVEANAEKMQNWKSQPYFIQDNFTGKRIDGGLRPDIVGKAAKAARPAGSTFAEFVPAKTIKEAESFLIDNNIVLNPNLDNVSVLEANEIVKTLNSVHVGSPLKKLSIYTGDDLSFGGVYYQATNEILLNKAFMKIKEGTPITREQLIKSERDRLAKYIRQQRFMEQEFNAKGVFKDDIEAIRKRLDNYKKPSIRHTVGSDIESIVTHEYGHKIHHLQKGGQADSPNFMQYIKELGGQKTNIRNQSGNLFYDIELKKEYKDWFMNNISEYSGASFTEAFAEAYVSYIKGEKLPIWLSETIEKAIKNAK